MRVCYCQCWSACQSAACIFIERKIIHPDVSVSWHYFVSYKAYFSLSTSIRISTESSLWSKWYHITLILLPPGVWLVFFLQPDQGSCLQSEEHLSLQINLSARGDRPADLDKLKPYVIEHIAVLLMAPTAGPPVGGQFVWLFWFCAKRQIICGNAIRQH